MSREETLRLKAVISCKLCKEPCNKAVSLICCGSASCRKCALDKLREDKTKCWGCGELSGDVNTPSQLVNNDLVRIGVAFFNKNQSDRVSATFEMFVLLSNTACSKNDEDKTKGTWHQLNRRNQAYVELYDEHLSSQSRVRDGDRLARLIRDGSRRPSPAVCKSGKNCNWKPECRFGHPEGGNMDTMEATRVFDWESRSWKPLDTRTWREDEKKKDEKVQRKLEHNAKATKRELEDSDKDLLELQLPRNKRNKTDWVSEYDEDTTKRGWYQLIRNRRNQTYVELYDEPDEQTSPHFRVRDEQPIPQFGVRNIFTGTGSPDFNWELGEGKRKWDGTTIQSFCKNRKSMRRWNRVQPLCGQAFQLYTFKKKTRRITRRCTTVRDSEGQLVALKWVSGHWVTV